MKLAAGQVAVVTGGASGIGLAIADRFAAQGLAVVATDVRKDTLMTAEERLGRHDVEIRTRAVDVRDAEAMRKLATEVVDDLGRVDIICNNAGVVGPLCPMWEQPRDIWDWVLGVSLYGTINGIRAFVPALVKQGSGHVLNVASVGGLAPLPMLAPYNAAKSAVIALSETLRAELAAVGVDVGVTVVCPGRVATDIRFSSRRNQPSEAGLENARWLGADRDDSAAPGELDDTATVLSAEDVADLALEGMQSNRSHVITHADSAPTILGRLSTVSEAVTAAIERRSK